MLTEVQANGHIALGKQFDGRRYDLQVLADGRVELVPVSAAQVPSAQATDDWVQRNADAIEQYNRWANEPEPCSQRVRPCGCSCEPGRAGAGMAGGSSKHADLIRNVGFALHSWLGGTPCSVKMTGMRLRIDAADTSTRDALVHCEPVDDPVTTVDLTEARLVVEVLSPGTQPFDRGGKLAAYRKLAGLQHIVLLSSNEQAAWACHRVPAGAAWSALAPWPRGTTLPLAGLGLELPWAEVYDGVGV